MLPYTWKSICAARHIVGSLRVQGDEFCVARAWDLSRRGQLIGTALSRAWCLEKLLENLVQGKENSF